MSNPLLPGPHQLTQQVIRVPYRVEQYQQEKNQEQYAPPREIPKPHDPLWNRRFWSIQHVHDCIEGKTFHWFWSPMAEVFTLSMAAFAILPVAVYINDRGANVGARGLLLLCLSLQLLMAAAKWAIKWYHDWRFLRVKYRVVRYE